MRHQEFKRDEISQKNAAQWQRSLRRWEGQDVRRIRWTQ